MLKLIQSILYKEVIGGSFFLKYTYPLFHSSWFRLFIFLFMDLSDLFFSLLFHCFRYFFKFRLFVKVHLLPFLWYTLSYVLYAFLCHIFQLFNLTHSLLWEYQKWIRRSFYFIKCLESFYILLLLFNIDLLILFK